MSNFLDKTGLQHYDEKIKVYVRTIAGGDVQRHEIRNDNPHHVDKGQVGLGNVTNEAQIPLSQKGVASGVATLGTDGKLTAAQLPAMKTVNGVSVVGSGNISIDLSLYKVVDTLPTTGIDATKIYIVPAKTTGDKNIKAEYVYTGNPASTYDASKWEKLGEAQTNIVVDAELNATSTNPIQNKAVKSAVDALNTTIAGKLNKTDYVVDAELSTTSTHPVQNKVVESAVNTLTSSVNSKVATSTYNTKMSALDSSISALQSKNTAQDSAIEKKLDKSAYIVDSELSATSKNPVQNLAVYQKFDWFDKNIRNKAYVQINAKIPSTPQATTGTAWAIVPNPVTSEAHADDDGWHGKELTFSSTLFATKEGLDSCVKKTDLVAITNEEIDAMF